MFNGMLKSDDVEVYEYANAANITSYFLTDTCKTNIVIFGQGGAIADINLPTVSYVGKVINITTMGYGTTPTGKINSLLSLKIKHSDTTLFTLKQGTVSFMYVGQQLNGLTATDKSKSGWIILGGVQGDTAITGYVGSIAIGSGAYCSGASAVAIGQAAVAANNSTAIGVSSSSSGTSAAAMGNGSTATGNNSTAIGNGAWTPTAYGVAIGNSAKATTVKLAFKANVNFSAYEDSQAGKFILMRQTTDATPTVITATNVAASSTNILNLPNTSAYSFTGQVVARDASTGDCVMWTITALIRRGANASTTALVGTPTVTKVFNDAGASAWTIALTADTTIGGGVITVTGEAGKTIRFVCNVDSAEVI